MIEVREVKKSEIDQASQFLIDTMLIVHPFPISERSMRDLNEMEELLINNKNSIFLAGL